MHISNNIITTKNIEKIVVNIGFLRDFTVFFRNIQHQTTVCQVFSDIYFLFGEILTRFLQKSTNLTLNLG